MENKINGFAMFLFCSRIVAILFLSSISFLECQPTQQDRAPKIQRLRSLCLTRKITLATYIFFLKMPFLFYMHPTLRGTFDLTFRIGRTFVLINFDFQFQFLFFHTLEFLAGFGGGVGGLFRSS